MDHTRQIAIEGLLPRVAAHMSLEGIAASMRKTLPGAAPPFACVFLLSVLNMRVVDVFD